MQIPSTTHHDPRLGTHDPRLGTHDPRLGTHDPRLRTNDPRLGTHDPRPTDTPVARRLVNHRVFGYPHDQSKFAANYTYHVDTSSHFVYFEVNCARDPTPKVDLYADDTTITCSADYKSMHKLNLNNSVAEIQNWGVSNKLPINVDKTDVMIVTGKSIESKLDFQPSGKFSDHELRQLENNKVKVSSVLQQKEAAILKVSEQRLREELKQTNKNSKSKEKTWKDLKKKLESKLDDERQKRQKYQHLYEKLHASHSAREQEVADLKFTLQQTQQVLDIELDRRRANSVPRLVYFFTVFMSKPGLLGAEGREFSLSSCGPIFLPRGNAQLARDNLGIYLVLQFTIYNY
ncbi:hypothetical protein P5673_032736 [Acropora cervicornis]|uniref:Reverse transcriptase domain-containing protein n=1 Tax=Acropora cervicornis TaxID=6130 RepID=A0AAD9URP5_ACRCE|nr:hypothetical protein P5673_032736 [Acropora cervicornis]